ncbi:MAG: hypothetical protein QXN08_04860 [Nitrososphaerales archaeon]
MKTKIVVIGLVLFVIGLYAGVINPSITIDFGKSFGLTYTSTVEENLLPLTLLRINAKDSLKVEIEIPNNPDRVAIVGSYIADGQLNFYLMDEDGLNAWQKGSAARLYDAAISQAKYNLTLKLEEAGRYYAVFENPQESQRSVVFTLNQKVLTYHINEQMEIIPQLTVLIGFILIIIGLKIGGKKKTA